MRRPRTAKSVFATVLLFTALASAAGASDAQTVVTSEVVERIVNGNVTGDFPSTGALLSPSNPNAASILCSGTMIGCQTFLTAGHCVADDLDPTHYTVFLQNAGFFSVKSIALHPDFNFPVGDVAVLSLGHGDRRHPPHPNQHHIGTSSGPVRYHRRVRPDRRLQSRLRHQARRQCHDSHVQERRVEYDVRLLGLPRARREPRARTRTPATAIQAARCSSTSAPGCVSPASPRAAYCGHLPAHRRQLRRQRVLLPRHGSRTRQAPISPTPNVAPCRRSATPGPTSLLHRSAQRGKPDGDAQLPGIAGHLGAARHA